MKRECSCGKDATYDATQLRWPNGILFLCSEHAAVAKRDTMAKNIRRLPNAKPEPKPEAPERDWEEIALFT